ncbi:MAG: short-chain dehydrogenase/reductase [Solirubrobacterales bacterium]
MSTYSLQGRVALVTGAERGIGFETARALHARGASVVLADLDGEATEQAAARIGERTLGLEADVTDRAAIANAVESAVERFGGLDIAVANAGIAPPGAVTTNAVDPDLFERVIEVNLMGVWRTAAAALPQVIERRGQIVVIASVYAFLNGAGAASYAASKAGVEALGRSLRAELAPHGASATVGYFGFVDTEMVRQAFEDPVARRIEERLPKFMSRRLPPSAAGEALAEGIEKRAQRVIEPAIPWRALFALRGLVNPLLDRGMERDRVLREIVLAADERKRAEVPTR